MCGIAGIVALPHARPATPEQLHSMCRSIAHRGPDDEGFDFEGRIGLGVRRLAVIDVAGGRQPIFNEDRSVRLVFNGEIYNFRELRAELVSCGHVFRSHTDAEVLLHGYEQWGLESLLTRARGMFAFALYDARRDGETKLYLVRDRFGIKPLYYALGDDTLSFASEITALVAGGAAAPEIDAMALVTFLELGSIPGPGTAVKDVRTLPAGHYLEVDG